ARGSGRELGGDCARTRGVGTFGDGARLGAWRAAIPCQETPRDEARVRRVALIQVHAQLERNGARRGKLIEERNGSRRAATKRRVDEPRQLGVARGGRLAGAGVGKEVAIEVHDVGARALHALQFPYLEGRLVIRGDEERARREGLEEGAAIRCGRVRPPERGG